ncbi:MAG: DUF4035 domain-containing protein [Burkholderiales bacterium]|jgi:hypothetical protein|nr:DUF4035 domain-containing protein [Burkholderiales bacterium]
MTPKRRFLHRLALQLGRTVAELKQTLTVSEFHDWLEFAKEEPFGDFRADAQLAQFMSMFANANRDEQKQKTPYTADDFKLIGNVSVDELKDGEVLVTAEMLHWMKN